MTRLSFWAQALDNSSPDHFEYAGVEIPHANTHSREAIASQVSEAIRSGVELLKDESHRIIRNRTHLLVEIRGTERDKIGRAAPIVCLADAHDLRTAEKRAIILDELDRFSTAIGREFNRGALGDALARIRHECACRPPSIADRGGRCSFEPLRSSPTYRRG